MVYYLAFNALSSSRQSGMGMGYIPYSEITDYLTENEIWLIEERKRFRHFITFIDGMFVSKEAKRSEAKNKKNTKK